MTTQETQDIPQNPVILRCHRIMEGFAKSDDERDFYLDRIEGFLVYVDLDKSNEELDELLAELENNQSRYVPIPKLTFYEVKKLMEGFVNEKVYDIDTKEKLLDIIQSKEARENFLEFIYDHHSEMEKWQQYYQERFRVRIIEWLRNHLFDFVFEEDIELTKSIVERIKINMFTAKVSKDIVQARKILTSKAATYYSNEALNPRPKRGRPPKQVVKVETEPQFSQDIYVAVPRPAKPFLFTPDYHSSSMIFTFSGKFTSEAELLAFRRQQLQHTDDFNSIGQKLAAIRTIAAPGKSSESYLDSEKIDFPQEGFSEGFESPIPSFSMRKASSPSSGPSKRENSSKLKEKVHGSALSKSSLKKSDAKTEKSPTKLKTSSIKPNLKSELDGVKRKKKSLESLKSSKKIEEKISQKREKQTVGQKKTSTPAASGSKQKIRLRPLVRKQKKSES